MALEALLRDPLTDVPKALRDALWDVGWLGSVGVSGAGADVLSRFLGLRTQWNGIWVLAE